LLTGAVGDLDVLTEPIHRDDPRIEPPIGPATPAASVTARVTPERGDLLLDGW
jgi:hypothetical protein